VVGSGEDPKGFTADRAERSLAQASDGQWQPEETCPLSNGQRNPRGERGDFYQWDRHWRYPYYKKDNQRETLLTKQRR